ncbi:MAG: hypothetical protein LH603_06615 [Pseudonocardia sp.]|nr:hypothetical protein [Pseudonocardia sp.]
MIAAVAASVASRRGDLGPHPLDLRPRLLVALGEHLVPLGLDLPTVRLRDGMGGGDLLGRIRTDRVALVALTSAAVPPG